MLVLARGMKVPARFGQPRLVHAFSESHLFLTRLSAGGGRSDEEKVNVHHTYIYFCKTLAQRTSCPVLRSMSYAMHLRFFGLSMQQLRL